MMNNNLHRYSPRQSKDRLSSKNYTKKQHILLFIVVSSILILTIVSLVKQRQNTINDNNKKSNINVLDSTIITNTNNNNNNNNIIPIVDKKKINKKKRIAYAITITKDGSFQDGAAVLAYSIIKLYRDNKIISRKYSISLIAFVHPMVIKARKELKKIGYHVIEATTPINSTAIPFLWFREHIEKNGCCGASELIKLNAYRLLQYDKIVHLDADVMVLRNFDELYDNDYSLIFTTDPNMADARNLNNQDKLPVQGGFLIIKPSLDDYLSLVNIMITTDFVMGEGWNNSGVGWYWGGMTIQGLLPYYYYVVTSPKRIKMVDRCLYNTMADTEECEVKKIDEIKSSHFTVCQKPWTCRGWDKDEGLCGALHRKWFDLRKEAEEFYGLPTTAVCPEFGVYKEMDLSNAIMNKFDFFIPDDSPDVLLPVGNSGYTYIPKKYREEGKGWISKGDGNRDKKRKKISYFK